MNIQLNSASSTPLYIQLKLSIREKILTGELPEQFKLPSERQLAQRLQVHRNTVVKAYEALISEGLVASSQKPRGYFVVNPFNEQGTKNNEPTFFSSADKNFNYRFTNEQNSFEVLYRSSHTNEGISFGGVLINREVIPVKYLKELMQEIIDGENLEPFWFCDSQGTEALRQNIAEMLFSRNIYVKPRNIQVIGETYEAIHNIALMYLNPGDHVVIEEPALPAIVNIFLHVGAKPLFVPIKQDGVQIDVLEKLVRQYKPKLIYTMPNYQNPSTCTMDIDKRKRLLKCARSYNIPIIEDDSLHEFNYKDARIPSLFFMDNSNSVIYLDTAGLSFYPGARLGYLVAPDNVIKTYQRIVNKNQLFLNSTSQYLWAKFFEKGFYEQHAVFLKEYYQKKRDLMCRCLQEVPEITFTTPEGGLCVWGELERELNDTQFAALCEKMGLQIMPGSFFFSQGNVGKNYLRLSFSSASDEEIVEGVSLLKKAIAAFKFRNGPSA